MDASTKMVDGRAELGSRIVKQGEVKIGQQDAAADASAKWVRIIFAPRVYRGCSAEDNNIEN